MNGVLTSSAIGGSDAQAFIGGGRRDSERAFRSAVRHSRGVRLLRLAVPAGVVVAIVILSLLTWFNPTRLLSQMPKEMGGSLVISGTKIKMEAPRVAGFTSDSRAYELSANAAAQDLTRPDMLELEGIHAKVELQDKSTMMLSARNGLYDTKTELLTLGQDIKLSSSSGFEGQLSEAVVDVRKGKIASEKPVAVKMLNGTLNANRIEVTEAGDVIRFGGGVSMNLTFDAQSGGKAGAP
ncbi:MAG TPA: LPS export ABC transporter periplasmic protein LptC [Xanthobacteraceae bacterium]|jgi:lipopolysaccharide export system protein LptC